MDNDQLVRMVGGDLVETVVSHDIIGRLMIQCARQPGLASVWEQLLGFDGGCSHDSLAGAGLCQAWLQLGLHRGCLHGSLAGAGLGQACLQLRLAGGCPHEALAGEGLFQAGLQAAAELG